ncbi:MAG: LysR family transcriptional regulator [Hyphomicrobiaceae bacterium]|nr:MAG: LysR family transcriptional regulator [Hyphomicrobiaceae bacterium]
MIDFRSLSTFVWVARLGGFRLAAKKLNTTQPAVSQRIARLEDELGVKLMVRDRKSVALTDSGRVVMDFAERLLQLRGEMVASISDRSRIRGAMRIGVAETIVHSWLPRFLERMSIDFPGVALEIEVDISPNLRGLLLGQQIDLAFLVGPISAPTIRNRLLCVERLGFYASPALGFGGRKTTLARIVEHPIITFSRNTQPFVGLSELLADPSLPLPRIHASASLATIVRMALDGIGVATIPKSVARGEVRQGKLVEIRCEARMPDLRFVAGWLATPDAGLVRHAVDMAVAVAGTSKR